MTMTSEATANCEICGQPMPEGEEIFKFHGYSGPCPVDARIIQFKSALSTMSHSRAGWDYQLPPAQKAKEDRECAEALARARSIWSENPNFQEQLRAAFKEASPLATMSEIEQQPA
jgi:hypothetical protein